MAIPSSGEVSIYGISQEFSNNAYTAVTPAEYNTQISIGTIASENTINKNSTTSPITKSQEAGNNSWNANGEYQTGSEIRIADFYGYDHDAAPAFTDTKAVSKSITTGESNAITFTDTADTFNFDGTDTWSISLWIKAGWSNTLNTNIHFIIGQKSSATYQLEDMIKIIYNESNNRIECRYGNKTASKQWYNQGGWLFHSNSGAYAAAYAAAGLGTTYWSASNRGNVGDDNFTMITITNDGGNTAASLRLYWNATAVGQAPIQTNNGSTNRTSIPISTTDDRLWSIGSNGVHSGQAGSGQQRVAGNSSATVYNDLTIWNKQLSDSEVSELYNSGTRLNAETHSAESNLVGYWKFEGNGNATRSSHNFTVSGDSSIVTI